MGKITDLTGNRYGKLTVVKRGPDRYGKLYERLIVRNWDLKAALESLGVEV